MSKAPSAKIEKQDLPEWNLNDLYSGPEAPELISDLDKAMSDSKAFAANYQGKLAEIDGKTLGQAIKDYEAIVDPLYRVMSYAQLVQAEDSADPEIGRFYQTTQERVNDISTVTLFFSLELNRIDNEVLKKQLSDPAAAHYQSWVRDTRAYRPHQLSDEMEKLLHEKSVVGRASWIRLFDELMVDMRFDVDGVPTTESDVLDMMSDKDAAVRKTGAKALGKGLNSEMRTLALITNTLAKDKEIEDGWRKFENPVSSRNLSNLIEDEVVEALRTSVQDSYKTLSHRYYGLKAKWFGTDQLDYWDRNAPLPDDDNRLYSWDDARTMVLDAYHNFEPSMSKIAGDFFDKRWIDAPPREGKSSGAFSHPTVSSAHPYVLLNYHGKGRDVMTLAHELGHGVHQVLAADQGTLMADTPLTLAETASVFGEMLTFQSMLKAESDPKRRKILLAGKVEDMMNTVVRQIAFFEFETRVHAERPNGELSADRIGEIWMDVQIESLGPSIRFDEDYRSFWGYIPHFIHSPFYVYAYAFGDCLVNSLYDVFQQGHPGFQEKYLEMLKAGGTLRHKELLAPFGLDASDPAFWKRGLGVIEGFIDELEKE